MAYSLDETRRSRLETEAEYLDQMINKIPAGVYVPQETEQFESWMKYGRNKQMNAPKQQIKETSKKGKKAARLNPTSVVTTTDALLKQKEDHEKEKEKEKPSKSSPKLTFSGSDRVDFSRSTDLEELRQRIKERLQQNLIQRSSEGGVRFNKDQSQTPARKRKLESPEVSTPEEVSETKQKKAKLSFSKVETTEEDPLKLKVGRAGSKLAKKKKFLSQAVAEKEEFEALKKTDKGREVIESRAWEKALSKAQGERIKDDPSKLKKSIKRDIKKKKNSAKKWKVIKEQVDKHIRERQEKRSENIKNKKERGKKTKKVTKRPGFEGKKQGFLNK